VLGAGEGEGQRADARGSALTQERLPPEVVHRLVAMPPVRAEAVERAKALLASATWCRAEEVAAELVDCYFTRRLP
ncbi:MAG TPA: hypothetical protein VHE80_03075, partial [Acidimicrobiales bacterium]|nr:hypothetical protein [Acidimicrobiales bacterium]